MVVFGYVKYQLLATVVGNILVLGQGTNAGWYSSALPLLKSDDTPLLDGALSTDMAGWVGAMISIGSLFGVLLFGSLALWIGFKRSLLLAAAPIISSWFLIIYGVFAWHLLLSRFLSGLTIGAVYVCMPQFVAEMSSDYIRGQLNSYMQIFFFSGVLLGYIGSSYLSYALNPWIMLSLPVIFSVGFWFIPDTPQQLLRGNRIDEAEKSLRFYRNCKVGTTNDKHSSTVQAELDKLIAIAKKNETERPLQLSDFLTPISLRTLMICPFLMAVNQFSGSFAISTYAVTVFEGTKSTIDTQLSSIVMAVLQVIGTYVASQLIDRAGRKLLLLVSTSTGFVMLMITGTYALLVDLEYELGGWDWVPVVSISAFIFVGAIGLLPVPYVMLAEVLPPRIRRVGAIICSCIVYVCQSTMLKIMPTLLEELHLFGCMYLFAGVILVGFVFTVVVVRETKGMNLDMLQPTDGAMGDGCEVTKPA